METLKSTELVHGKDLEPKYVDDVNFPGNYVRVCGTD
jgi:hypothetical protein